MKCREPTVEKAAGVTALGPPEACVKVDVTNMPYNSANQPAVTRVVVAPVGGAAGGGMPPELRPRQRRHRGESFSVGCAVYARDFVEFRIPSERILPLRHIPTDTFEEPSKFREKLFGYSDPLEPFAIATIGVHSGGSAVLRDGSSKTRRYGGRCV